MFYSVLFSAAHPPSHMAAKSCCSTTHCEFFLHQLFKYMKPNMHEWNRFAWRTNVRFYFQLSWYASVRDFFSAYGQSFAKLQVSIDASTGANRAVRETDGDQKKWGQLRILKRAAAGGRSEACTEHEGFILPLTRLFKEQNEWNANKREEEEEAWRICCVFRNALYITWLCWFESAYVGK